MNEVISKIPPSDYPDSLFDEYYYLLNPQESFSFGGFIVKKSKKTMKKCQKKIKSFKIFCNFVSRFLLSTKLLSFLKGKYE